MLVERDLNGWATACETNCAESGRTQKGWKVGVGEGVAERVRVAVDDNVWVMDDVLVTVALEDNDAEDEGV